VPALEEAFPRLYEVIASLLSPAQVDAIAQDLGLGPGGRPPLPGEAGFRERFPEVMLAVNRRLSPEQLEAFLGGVRPEDLAAQSFALGDEGRKRVLGELDDERVRKVLDLTPDWVLLETGRRALARFGLYTATLRKEERVEGKISGVEVIALKIREAPRAFFMQWLDGPNKGRKVLYNEKALGPGKIRVREKGLLGLAAVTLDVDSPLARRGTRHLATEVGLSYLVSMLEKDYRVAAGRGHITRQSHGLVTVEGHRGYRLESRLPRDPSLGYYAYRVIHDMDYLEGYPFRVEVYDFDDRLSERYHYLDVNQAAPLTELDFDPRNRDYKL
jgi:hypothetical protein